MGPLSEPITMRPVRSHTWHLAIGILGGSSITLILVLVNTIVQSKSVGFLVFVLPILWLLWIASALLDPRGRLFYLAALWVLVDVMALAIFLSIQSVHGDWNQSQGAESAFAIAYLPFMPAMGVFTRIFPVTGTPGMLGEWATFSMLAALASVLLLATSWGVRALRAL
jgi:hypothetical protein